MSYTQLSTTTKTHICSRVVSKVKSTVTAHPRVAVATAVATAVVTAGGVVYYYRHWLAERTFSIGESVWRLYADNSKEE